ncbi:type II/IV secretion system ATP hydrolase [Desulfocucumis palustris]|uniref:Type II/IV secretion system ATP hydrolase n=1 Tax=Desulfocucumis palustris TaxID=1898651 RepID=A0A2L2XJ48_9FIRM|nr:ATPase, T2SS/T4P/T4SS family [Desulfocucumis palustris]GBF33951.1 type II/IV secretion system ATP hydrolase [Desulfocucumis palustris]
MATIHKFVKVGELPLEKFKEIFAETIVDKDRLPESLSSRRDAVMQRACAGYPGASLEAVSLITDFMVLYNISVEGLTGENAAWEVYKSVWGLDILEDLYNDPEVQEIDVNGPDCIYVLRNGKWERVDIKFPNGERIKDLINRLILHDNVSITTSNPFVESKRADGNRITAAIPPIAKHPTICLRKLNTFEYTLENLTRAGTLNEKVYKLLELLVKGRANILISGGTNTAKTSLLQHMVSFMHKSLRLITLENKFELELGKRYPYLNIVEFEEDPGKGVTLKSLFRLTLHLTPDIIIVGEIRGLGEAVEAIKACLRGHDGSIATIHTSSVEEAINGLAMMNVEEGKNLPLELVRLQAASAFNVIIQMYSSPTAGIKKIIRVTEVYVKNDQIVFKDLCKWVPDGDNYLVGDWVFPNKPSSRLTERFIKHGVTPEQMRAADFTC